MNFIIYFHFLFIKELNKEITNLKQQLQDEINKNNDLNIQIQELKNLYQQELNQNSLLVQTNKKLNDELSTIKKEKEENQKSYSEKIIALYEKIDEFKEKLARYPVELLKGEKLISVIFSSTEEAIYHSVICKNTEKFSRLVEELYNYYPEYSKSKYYFNSNGKEVDMLKSLKDNNIHNSDIIILNKVEF